LTDIPSTDSAVKKFPQREAGVYKTDPKGVDKTSYGPVGFIEISERKDVQN
jgi:hypothetical protein